MKIACQLCLSLSYCKFVKIVWISINVCIDVVYSYTRRDIYRTKTGKKLIEYFYSFFNLSNLKTKCTWTYVRERVDYKPRTKRFLALLQKYFIRYMVYMNVSKRQALSLFNGHYCQRRHFCMKKEELRYIRFISNTTTLMFYQFVFFSFQGWHSINFFYKI